MELGLVPEAPNKVVRSDRRWADNLHACIGLV